jgi:predicted CoA-binding protein
MVLAEFAAKTADMRVPPTSAVLYRRVCYHMAHPNDTATASPQASLQSILAPRTIAVIGATPRPGSMGRQVLSNLIDFGFTGRAYPVHPRAPSVRSVRAYATIGDVPEPVDLAVIVIPRDHVLDAVTQCGAAGVKGLVVITAGFREVGGDGVALEASVMQMVREHGMRLVGPNCMGVINTDPAVSMNATFAPVMATPRSCRNRVRLASVCWITRASLVSASRSSCPSVTVRMYQPPTCSSSGSTTRRCA